ncbi:MAG: sigma-70 family RNA polymerase sigma factor [Clostridia bacterium]|nr:sigma-70 family RNA polymerase sigma factor [Clostridia bacterium]
MSICENKSELVDLIEKVRKDDQSAFAQMLDKYKPLLDSAVSKFSKDEIARSHEDDLRQEATLVFYNAILNYDLGGDGVEFGLYAKICVTNALISQIRNMNRRKAEHFSITDDEVRVTVSEEPSARIIEQESLRHIDSVIRNNLSAFEYRVWCLYASGRTAKEVGALVGKSEKSVSNAIYRIRQKLRKLLS